LRIAILSCFYPFRGGISQFNACLFSELSKTNVVKAFNFKRQYPEFLFPGKTQYVTADDEAVPVESTALLDTANPFSYISTLRGIRRWKPDLLIVRYWMSYFAPSLGFITRHMGKECKVISILDNVIPHERHFFDAPFTKYFLKGSDGCITLCEAVGKDLKALSPEKKNIVLQHPLYSHFGKTVNRTEAEEMMGLEHGRRNILFFGLIREYKGLDILLEAYGQLPDTYQLIIAGEPYGLFDRYQSIIDGMDEKKRRGIHCELKYIKDSEVAKYFSVADVAVLPYRSATQSGISSISYHFEVPMIVTKVGGLEETISDRGTGIAVDRCCPEDIRIAIEEYFSDSSIRDKCIENIKKEKDRLGWSSFCQSLVEFAKEL